MAAGRPDALQLSAGQARELQRRQGPKPALVLRSDVANVYGARPTSTPFSVLTGDPVAQAVRLDAACVVVNILLIEGQPDLHRQCIENVALLREQCVRFGMPLMVEPLAMTPRDDGGGYATNGDTDTIVALVRQAVEMGADVIKSDPTANLDEYRQVVEAAGGRPVLVRGGGKVAPGVVAQRAIRLLKQGASGVVYGRNVFQDSDPSRFTAELMRIVHGVPNQDSRPRSG